MTTRRKFIKNTATGAAGITLLSSANSYASILGANDSVNFAILGCGGRAHGLVKAIAASKQGKVTAICDVDANRLNKFKNFWMIQNYCIKFIVKMKINMVQQETQHVTIM